MQIAVVCARLILDAECGIVDLTNAVDIQVRIAELKRQKAAIALPHVPAGLPVDWAKAAFDDALVIYHVAPLTAAAADPKGSSRRA